MTSKHEDFERMLLNHFPDMFDGSDIGLWVDEGWHRIVFTLCYCIRSHIERTNSRISWMESRPEDYNEDEIPEPVEPVRVAQIKEKFGQLRFYYDGGDEYVAGLVNMAEHWADSTCEKCGDHGRVRHELNWVKTLCEPHFKELMDEQIARSRANGWK